MLAKRAWPSVQPRSIGEQARAVTSARWRRRSAVSPRAGHSWAPAGPDLRIRTQNLRTPLAREGCRCRREASAKVRTELAEAA